MQDPAPAPITVHLTWGEALQLATGQSRVPGGLKRAHTAITLVFGGVLGTRPSFQKLFDVPTSDALTDAQQRRAWALLAVTGNNPADPVWGLPPVENIYPFILDPRSLRARLEAAMVEVQGPSHPAGSSIVHPMVLSFAA